MYLQKKIGTIFQTYNYVFLFICNDTKEMTVNGSR